MVSPTWFEHPPLSKFPILLLSHVLTPILAFAPHLLQGYLPQFILEQQVGLDLGLYIFSSSLRTCKELFGSCVKTMHEETNKLIFPCAGTIN